MAAVTELHRIYGETTSCRSADFLLTLVRAHSLTVKLQTFACSLIINLNLSNAVEITVVQKIFL
jgi:hypothetical protein